MDHHKFALRMLMVLMGLALVLFSIEAIWDFKHAVHPVTGRPLTLEDIHVSAAMARAVASPFARAYNNILALLLTFVALAIPLTANLYTPKLVEIFIRDKINILMLCSMSLLAAHSLFAISLSFDNWTPQLPFWIDGIGALVGWLVLMPYYFYVLSFIDPLTIIKRVHLSLMHELDDVVAGKYPIGVAQQRANQRIINLGSMLQRSVDRADRDVAFDAIKAHTLDLARVREFKPKLPDAFFMVDNSLMVGMARPACEMLSREKIWMEHRIASQLVLAFKTALSKMPEGVSALARAVKNAAHEEANHHNQAVFQLLVRTMNSFLREAIKKKENSQVYAVIYNYKSLIRRMMRDNLSDVMELVQHQHYYAEFARTHGLPFVYELMSYQLAELTEFAYGQQLPYADAMLQAVLDFEDVEKHVGLIKSRVVLAAYLMEKGYPEQLSKIKRSLETVPESLLQRAIDDLMNTTNPVFWEVTERGNNIDYVEPARRERVHQIFIDMNKQHTAKYAM